MLPRIGDCFTLHLFHDNVASLMKELCDEHTAFLDVISCWMEILSQMANYTLQFGWLNYVLLWKIVKDGWCWIVHDSCCYKLCAWFLCWNLHIQKKNCLCHWFSQFLDFQFIFSTAIDGKIKAWLYDNMGSRVDYDAPGHWCTTMLYSADGSR